MHRTLLATAVTPDNTPHGYNLTFAFPMLEFIIVAGVLYLILISTHRVPGHVSLQSSRWAKGSKASGTGRHASAPPDATQTVQHEPGEGAEGGE